MQLRPDLPRNEWINDELFIHEVDVMGRFKMETFVMLMRGRPRWMFFLPGWIIFKGRNVLDTDDGEFLAGIFYTKKGARKIIDETYQHLLTIIEECNE